MTEAKRVIKEMEGKGFGRDAGLMLEYIRARYTGEKSVPMELLDWVANKTKELELI